MGTVTGVTTERFERVKSKVVVSGEIDSSTGSLILTRGDGSKQNAGVAVPEVKNDVLPINYWPVGSIYVSVSGVDPAKELGGGKWVRWFPGRTPVSLDASDTLFDTVEEAGGTKTASVDKTQMPSHQHGSVTTGRTADHQHMQSFIINQAGGNAIRYEPQRAAVGSTAYPMNANTDGPNQDHIHGVNYDGGSQAHNNLQPYIVSYVWKRTE